MLGNEIIFVWNGLKYPCEIFHKILCLCFFFVVKTAQKYNSKNESNTLAWIITHDTQDYTCAYRNRVRFLIPFFTRLEI